MVRGIQKQVIHLKNPESPLFEEAFLIVKPTARKQVPAMTMVEEANRLLAVQDTIQESSRCLSPIQRTLRGMILFFSGTLFGVLATLLCAL